MLIIRGMNLKFQYNSIIGIRNRIQYHIISPESAFPVRSNGVPFGEIHHQAKDKTVVKFLGFSCYHYLDKNSSGFSLFIIDHPLR